MKASVLNGLLRIEENSRIRGINSLLALFIFAICAPRFSLRNITSLLTIIAELGIMTVGISFLMIGGEIDLSVSSAYATAGLSLLL